MADFTDFLGDNGLDFLQGLIGRTTPDIDLGSTDPADFREQAEGEVSDSGFFDKNLDIVKKTLDLVKTQRKEQKAQAERQEQESFTDFRSVQDRGFARTLGRASGRFAGKGTATSGARQERLGEFFEDKGSTLEEQDRLLRQSIENRNLGFTQFLAGKDLEFEGSKLDIDRGRESQTLSRQQQLAQQTGVQNTELRQQSNRDFVRTLGEESTGNFSSFLNQSLAG